MRFAWIERALIATAACALLSCQAERLPGHDTSPAQGGTPAAPTSAPPPTGVQGTGDERPEFCDRPGADAVRDVFCGTAPPAIASLLDLQGLLSLAFLAPDGGASEYAPLSGFGGQSSLRAVLLAHSTALSGAVVSPINPRVIILGQNSLMAFNRGVQQAELVSFDRVEPGLNFYLVTFEQACNRAGGGCTPSDLYTPRVESGWTSVTIRDAEELADTPSDCRQCHQRALDHPILLMRELEGPWTHFFAPDQGETSTLPEASGIDLVRDYAAAKGDESYGGLPSAVIRQTAGLTLQGSVNLPQPLIFDGSTILNERWPYGPDGYPSVPSRSATWYGAYEAFKRGEQLPLPYFDPRPTDPTKQARLTAAYQGYLADPLGAGGLPDFADVFPDDPQTRAEIGLQTEPQASAAQALVQACGSCHNDVLDQSLSRARFNVALSRLGRAELDVAILRLKAARGTPGSMPPPGRRQLDADGLKRLIDYLESDARSSDDDALLERAARLGMAGGQKS